MRVGPYKKSNELYWDTAMASRELGAPPSAHFLPGGSAPITLWDDVYSDICAQTNKEPS